MRPFNKEGRQKYIKFGFEKGSKNITYKKKSLGGGTIYLLFIYLFILLFRDTPEAYVDSQARGRIGATTASLQHSHSNMRAESCLQPTPQLMAMPDP